jgi:hypothetical protein
VWRLVGHAGRVRLAELPAPAAEGGAPWDG